MKRHDANFRCARLLEAVRNLPCQFQIMEIEGKRVCEGGEYSQACHSNQQLHGKGKSMKAHDCFIAAGCPSCHREVDQGMRLSREMRIHYFQVAHDRTMLLLWQKGVIVVQRG